MNQPRKKIFSIATETISFQQTPLATKLIEFVSKIRATKRSERKVIIGYLVDMSNLIMKHTGLCVNITLDTTSGTATGTAINLSTNHILASKRSNDHRANKKVGQGIVDYLNTIVKQSGDTFVDTKKGKVSGIYSEIRTDVQIDTRFFFNENPTKMTDEEIAAVLLHELGHIFTGFEYGDRICSTNQVMQAVLDDEFINGDKAIKQHVFELCEKYLKHKLVISKDLEPPEDYNPETTSVVLLGALDKKRSYTDSAEYDRISSEQLADAFVARHGLALPLATSLNKMTLEYRDYVGTGYNSNKQILAVVLSALAAQLGGSLIAISIKGAAVVPFHSLFAFCIGATILISGFNFLLPSKNDVIDDTYDMDEIRISRIKEELIRMLRITKKDDPISMQIVKDIETIASLIKQIPPMKIGILTKFYNAFIKSNKDINAVRTLHRNLEILSANDIYVSSAKLSALS